MCRSSPEKNSAPENLRLVRRNQAGSGRRRLTRRSSLHSDRNCISRAAEVGQAHRDSRSRRDAVRHLKVHLENTRDTGVSPKYRISVSSPPIDTYGGITPPSNRLVVYIDGTSPAVAALANGAIFRVSACQIASWPVPLPIRAGWVAFTQRETSPKARRSGTA